MLIRIFPTKVKQNLNTVWSLCYRSQKYIVNQEVKKQGFVSSCVVDLNKLLNLSVELSLSIFKMRKTGLALYPTQPKARFHIQSSGSYLNLDVTVSGSSFRKKSAEFWDQEGRETAGCRNPECPYFVTILLDHPDPCASTFSWSFCVNCNLYRSSRMANSWCLSGTCWIDFHHWKPHVLGTGSVWVKPGPP